MKLLLVVFLLILRHSGAWVTNLPVTTLNKRCIRHTTMRLHEVPTSHKLDLNLLLIDHYDSFTYNLVDILAQYTSRPPIVVAADAATSWDDLIRQQQEQQNFRPFDGVILSPGPGHPDDPLYALSRDCIRQNSKLPILGVCLGHQMLGTVYGATVDLAPEPIHGQVRNIRLLNKNIKAIDPLWEDITDNGNNPISVTRYHSFHVFDLNTTSLVPTTMSDDMNSTVMSMRHKEYPHFGLQFHPESIGTNETGKKLLRNFVRFCSQQQRESNRFVETSVPDCPAMVPYKKLLPALQKHGIYIHKVPNLPPNGANMRPLDVVHEILSNASHYFWLDEARPISESSVGVSILGASNRRVEYWGKDKPRQIQGVSVWDDTDTLVFNNRTMDIMSYLHDQHIDITNDATLVNFDETVTFESLNEDALSTILPFDYRGGHVGFLGYEVRYDTQRYQDTSVCANSNVPDAIEETNDATVPTSAFLWADKSFVFDHRTDEWYLVGVQSNTDENDTIANSDIICWMKSMSKRLTEGIRSRPSNTDSKPYLNDEVNMPFFTPNRSQSTYIKNFAKCVEHIRQGESYELCLTNQFGCRVPKTAATTPLNLYKILRRRNPAPFSAFFHWSPDQNQITSRSLALKPKSTVSICCTSPERFVSVKRKQQQVIDASPRWEVEAKPIKGTIQRIVPSNGRNSLTEMEVACDRELAHQLHSSVKDRAENLMIVDLLRNDLSQVCETGSIHVSKLMDIESFATVHQMVSTIRGTLSENKNTIEVLKACFPGGSMTGAPKLRTMELLHEIEERASRGPYSGCLGYISLNGCMDMNIIIRTAVLTPEWSTQEVSSRNRQQNDMWKVSIGAGGAITALSQAHDEYNEMKLKASAIIGAVEEWASSQHHEDANRQLAPAVEFNSTLENKNSTLPLECVES